MRISIYVYFLVGKHNRWLLFAMKESPLGNMQDQYILISSVGIYFACQFGIFFIFMNQNGNKSKKEQFVCKLCTHALFHTSFKLNLYFSDRKHTCSYISFLLSSFYFHWMFLLLLEKGVKRETKGKEWNKNKFYIC